MIRIIAELTAVAIAAAVLWLYPTQPGAMCFAVAGLALLWELDEAAARWSGE